MHDRNIDAANIARKYGLNEKSFRARLRRKLLLDHTRGSWSAPIDSRKRRRMERAAESNRKEMTRSEEQSPPAEVIESPNNEQTPDTKS